MRGTYSISRGVYQGACAYAIERKHSVKTIHDLRYVKLIDLFKARRKELGLTQTMVAKSMGLPRTWLSRVETRERRIDVLETQTLLNLYGLSLSAVETIFEDRGRGANGRKSTHLTSGAWRAGAAAGGSEVAKRA